jgi:transposase
LNRRIVLDILPDRQKKTLVQWLTAPPAGIDLTKLTFAATDLWQHYRDGVQSVFPHVAVVADRFHVVQNLHKVIHEARREAQKAAKTEDEKKQLKGLRYLLLKNKQNLTQKDRERLQKLAESHPDLHRLWELRQELHDWYEVRTIPEFARITLALWMHAARQLDMEALDKFCKMLESWQKEIINFFEHRITSGFVEGMNSKIRVLKRIAFGIPNYAHFRLRIIGFCG